MRNIVSPLDGIRSPFGRRLGNVFSPLSLFASNEPGGWYDPSDLTTLYQDAAGTTPVTAVEQPVGLILDKSGRGNHASQSTSTSRPTLSARVNLLTYSEDWRNTATAGSTRPWTYNSATITADATTAPDGTLTADALLETATTSAHLIFQQITGTAGFTYRASVSIKANGRDYAFVRVSDAVSNIHAVSVNLTNGTAASANGSPTNITCTAQANGFYRVTFDAPGYSTTQFDVLSSTNGVYANRSFLGDITKGVYVWGADMRLSNTGVGLPAYQRVGAATDYDTSGFPYYLSFDGTDDFLVTGTITPGSVDKAQVFAGVRKLSDAVGAVIAEWSAAWFNNAGTFAVTAPNSVGAGDYRFVSRGSLSTGGRAVSPATFVAPITNVLTGIGDISADVSILRINGSQVAIDNTTDQGTGNYLSYPLYIGRRGGTTLPFNGNLYSLIIRFSATNLDAATIAATETWVNGKTKAF